MRMKWDLNVRWKSELNVIQVFIAFSAKLLDICVRLVNLCYVPPSMETIVWEDMWPEFGTVLRLMPT